MSAQTLWDMLTTEVAESCHLSIPHMPSKVAKLVQKDWHNFKYVSGPNPPPTEEQCTQWWDNVWAVIETTTQKHAPGYTNKQWLWLAHCFVEAPPHVLKKCLAKTGDKISVLANNCMGSSTWDPILPPVVFALLRHNEDYWLDRVMCAMTTTNRSHVLCSNACDDFDWEDFAPTPAMKLVFDAHFPHTGSTQVQHAIQMFSAATEYWETRNTPKPKAWTELHIARFVKQWSSVPPDPHKIVHQADKMLHALVEYIAPLHWQHIEQFLRKNQNILSTAPQYYPTWCASQIQHRALSQACPTQHTQCNTRPRRL